MYRIATVLFALLPMLSAAPVAADVPLIGSDTAAGDNFGTAVAISGDLAVVGSPDEVIGGLTFHGAAYVFEQTSPGVWNQIDKLTASDGEEFDEFGDSVAIDGNTIVVGAPFATVGTNSQQGAVYVFDRDGATFSETIILSDPGGGALDHFGSALDIQGDRLAIGIDGDEKAWIAERNEGGADNWGMVATLTATDFDSNSELGDDLDLDGDRIAVGAPRADLVPGSFDNEGAVYIFDRNQGGADVWGQVVKITAGDADGSDRFGDAVALDCDILVVGATAVDDGPDFSVGAVYFISYSGGAIWTEEQKVLGSEAFASLGRAVEVAGTTALAGEPASFSPGRVILFERNQGGPGNWGSTGEEAAPTPQVEDLFGDAVDIDGGDAAIGAFGTSSFTGAAYVFEELVPAAPFFCDGFESGDTSAWSSP